MISLQYSTFDRSKSPLDAWRIAVLMLAASIIELGVVVYGIMRLPAWQHYIVLAAVILHVASSIASVVLVRRGQIEPAMIILVIGIWLVCSAAGWIYKDMALSTGIIAMLISIYVVFQTLPRRIGGVVIIAGILLILINSGMSWMKPSWQVLLIDSRLTYLILPLPILMFVVMTLRRFRTYSQRVKLVILFLAVSLVGIVSTAFLVALFASDILSEDAGIQLKNTTQAKASTIGELLDRQHTSLNTLATNRLLQQAIIASNDLYSGDLAQDLAEALALDQQWQAAGIGSTLVQERLNNTVSMDLREYLGIFSGVEQVLVTDRLGALVATTEFHPNYYLGNTTWWRSAYNNGDGGNYFSQPEIDEDSGEYYIILAVPVRERGSDDVIGVLQANLAVKELLSLMSADLGSTGELDLYFSGRPTQAFHQGVLISADPETLAMLRSIESQPYAEVMLDGSLKIISQTRVHTASGNQSIDNLGWTIIAHQSRDEALSAVQNLTRLITMWAMIITLLTAGFAYIIGMLLTGPVIRLTKVAEQVASGNLNVQAKVETPDEIGLLAETFNGMIAQLSEMVGTLEQRVAERTRALETSVTISRRISTILDQRTLIRAVVDQIQQAFGYYHVHIYLYDNSRQNLVMAGGSGAIGDQLLEQGHKISRGKGLVGRTADSNAPTLVSDVTTDSAWLPNPLLPATKSEVAVPISLGETVLGVLDVQNNAVGSLGPQDVSLLTSIANQLAVAIQNARTYNQAQQQALRESLISTITQKIQGTTTAAEAMQVAIREAGRATGAPRVQVKLIPPSENE
ncbi:MAG TPA: GAF domain-containing protein [Anaerolineales bacterium]|nr:GAF domain-containing protein [Anaerolineales bacterium]